MFDLQFKCTHKLLPNDEQFGLRVLGESASLSLADRMAGRLNSAGDRYLQTHCDTDALSSIRGHFHDADFHTKEIRTTTI